MILNRERSDSLTEDGEILAKYFRKEEKALKFDDFDFSSTATEKRHSALCLMEEDQLRERLNAIYDFTQMDSYENLSGETLDNFEKETNFIIERLNYFEGRKAILSGCGTLLESIADDNKSNRGGITTNMEKTTFFNQFVENRSASGKSGMTAVIPTEIVEDYVVNHEVGGFYDNGSITAIAHGGDVKIPVATAQTISAHTENNAVGDAGYVPAAVTITHAEYAYNTAYSDLGFSISTSNFEQIIEDTLLQSMLKAMDKVMLGAVAGATYTDGTNAVAYTNGGAPTYAEFVELAGYLGSSYLDNAKWYLSPSTYFNLMLGLLDDADKPLLDVSKKIEDQAFLGFGIVTDSNIPDGVIYFGDGQAVHLNYAREPEINTWTDYDYNQEKAGIRCVAGAGIETGCFVKMFEASA